MYNPLVNRPIPRNQPYGSPLELRVEGGKVEIVFPKATKWVRLTPEQAEAIGHKLVEFSRTASGKIVVPGILSH